MSVFCSFCQRAIDKGSGTCGDEHAGLIRMSVVLDRTGWTLGVLRKMVENGLVTPVAGRPGPKGGVRRYYRWREVEQLMK